MPVDGIGGIVAGSPAKPVTAAALIIGNEILSGKLADQNVQPLAEKLFRLGVPLRRVVICADDIAAIVADLGMLQTTTDHVFTSGGVGPTHDDVTMKAVATYFGRPLVRSAELEAHIRQLVGDRLNEGYLRMANVPEGAKAIHVPSAPWPLIAVGNVYIMPGVPAFFRRILSALDTLVGQHDRPVSRALMVRGDEASFAAALTAVAEAHPAVAIGSYPEWGEHGHRVKLTFDGSDVTAVERAGAEVVAMLADRSLGFAWIEEQNVEELTSAAKSTDTGDH